MQYIYLHGDLDDNYNDQDVYKRISRFSRISMYLIFL